MARSGFGQLQAEPGGAESNLPTERVWSLIPFQRFLVFNSHSRKEKIICIYFTEKNFFEILLQKLTIKNSKIATQNLIRLDLN